MTTNRTLSLERLYYLGDYRNVKFGDTITEIPEEVSNKPKAMQIMRYLQLLDTEFAFTRYLALREKTHALSTEDTLAFLEEERVQTFTDLLDSLQGE